MNILKKIIYSIPLTVFALNSAFAVECAVKPCTGNEQSGTTGTIGGTCLDFGTDNKICFENPSSIGGTRYSITDCGTCQTGYVPTLTSVETKANCTVTVRTCQEDTGGEPGGEPKNCQVFTCPSQNLTQDTGYRDDNVCTQKERFCYRNSDKGTTWESKRCKCPEGYTALVGYTYSSMSLCNVPVVRCIEIGVIPKCPDECPSMISWTDDTMYEGRQAICVESGSKRECKYRCKSNYYNIAFVGAEPKCIACPNNATCAGGDEMPKCRSTFYRSRKQVSGGLQSLEYECIPCPFYNTGSQSLQGMSQAGSDSITDCYEPVGAGHENGMGYYEILESGCYYVTPTGD